MPQKLKVSHPPLGLRRLNFGSIKIDHKFGFAELFESLD